MEDATKIRIDIDMEGEVLDVEIAGTREGVETAITTLIAVYAVDNDEEPTAVVDRICGVMKALEKEGFTKKTLKEDEDILWSK